MFFYFYYLSLLIIIISGCGGFVVGFNNSLISFATPPLGDNDLVAGHGSRKPIIIQYDLDPTGSEMSKTKHSS